MKTKRLQDADVKNKKVLIRVDFNVPVKNGKVTDDTRITQTLPTLKYLVDQGAKIIIVSHLGRPDGKVVEEMRMEPVSKVLSTKLGLPIKQLREVTGENVKEAAGNLKEGEIIFLENVRFDGREEKNDPTLAKELADLAEIYVSDSFATAHRAHASTVGIAKFLPAYAGLLMQKEVEHLGNLLEDVQKPLTLVIGGAKIDTKIGLVENFLGKADNFLIGGGLANTFLAAEGFDIGKSLYEKDKIEIAQKTMMEADTLKKNFVLPEDVVVADEVKPDAETVDLPAEDVEGEMKILDIGVKTTQNFADIIAKSKTVIWNGPVGLSEMDIFSRGTKGIAKALTENKHVKSIIGGGDTIEAFKRLGFNEDQFTFVSTGGGAMLEFLEGKTLPGVEILLA